MVTKTEIGFFSPNIPNTKKNGIELDWTVKKMGVEDIEASRMILIMIHNVEFNRKKAGV